MRSTDAAYRRRRGVHRAGRCAVTLRRTPRRCPRVSGGVGRDRGGADARQPRHASGERDGRRRRPRADRRGPFAARGRSRFSRSGDIVTEARKSRLGRRPPSACSQARRRITSPRTRSTGCSRRHTSSAAVPIAWDFVSRVRASRTRAAPTSSPTRRRSASLQVPASGQPILLMADRQTTGGYPKIATVIAADLGDRRPARARATRRFAVCTHARGDGGADRAGARADGARGARRVNDFAAAMRARVRRRSRARARAAGAADDVPRGRTGRLAGRDAQQRRDRYGAVDRARRRRAGDDARRRIERAGLRRRCARPRDSAARRRCSRSRTRGTFAPMRR